SADDGGALAHGMVSSLLSRTCGFHRRRLEGMSRQTEYFAVVGSAGVAMLGVGMFAGTRAVRARPPCSWGLVFVNEVGDSLSDCGCLVLLKEMAGRQQHGGVHRQRVLNRAAAVASEHAVTLSPHHLSGVGPRMEPF